MRLCKVRKNNPELHRWTNDVKYFDFFPKQRPVRKQKLNVNKTITPKKTVVKVNDTLSPKWK